MKLFRKLICWIFGHRSITKFTYSLDNKTVKAIIKCERCGYTQVDTLEL